MYQKLVTLVMGIIIEIIEIIVNMDSKKKNTKKIIITEIEIIIKIVGVIIIKMIMINGEVAIMTIIIGATIKIIRMVIIGIMWKKKMDGAMTKKKAVGMKIKIMLVKVGIKENKY